MKIPFLWLLILAMFLIILIIVEYNLRSKYMVLSVPSWYVEKMRLENITGPF